MTWVMSEALRIGPQHPVRRRRQMYEADRWSLGLSIGRLRVPKDHYAVFQAIGTVTLEAWLPCWLARRKFFDIELGG